MLRQSNALLSFTDTACAVVRSYLAAAGHGRGLRIVAVGNATISDRVELVLTPERERRAEDRLLDLGAFQVFMDPRSAKTLQGSTIDYVDRVDDDGFIVESGFRIRRGPRCAWGPDLDADVEARVVRVLADEVNPAIEAHGGRVSLVAVTRGVALVQMHGGCQRCRLAWATLHHAVERLVRSHVPEIEAVADVTPPGAVRAPGVSRIL